MSRFVTDLRVLKLTMDNSADQRGSWRLLSPFVYFSQILGRHVIVPSGFLTDFASVPRVPVAFLLTGDSGHEAAVIHDWLYTSHEVNRSTADAVFREALEAGGEPSWRAWLMWAGVRLGGAGPYEDQGQEQPPIVGRLLPEGQSEAP